MYNMIVSSGALLYRCQTGPICGFGMRIVSVTPVGETGGHLCPKEVENRVGSSWNFTLFGETWSYPVRGELLVDETFSITVLSRTEKKHDCSLARVFLHSISRCEFVRTNFHAFMFWLLIESVIEFRLVWLLCVCKVWFVCLHLKYTGSPVPSFIGDLLGF